VAGSYRMLFDPISNTFRWQRVQTFSYRLGPRTMALQHETMSFTKAAPDSFSVDGISGLLYSRA
jgi:hypothetical protein